VTLVLAVDDDPTILRTLAINLRARGYEAVTASNGRSAVGSVREEQPDLVVLDLGLPDLDGIDVLTQIRAVSTVPVIVLSARHGSKDKVTALDLGANDYVTKPFGIEELFARLRAALRHASQAPGNRARLLRTETLELDLSRRLAYQNGSPVHLTPTEWRLVEALTRTPGHLVKQADLLQEVWGPAYQQQTNYLRVYLGQLRRKLEPQPGRPRHFITEPGVGYRFIP